MGRVRLADVHLPIPQKPPSPSYSTRQSTNIDVTAIHSPNDSSEFSLDTITCRMTGVRVFFLFAIAPLSIVACCLSPPGLGCVLMQDRKKQSK